MKKINVLFLGRGVIAEECLMRLLRNNAYKVVGIASNKDPSYYWWKSDYLYRTAVANRISFINCETPPAEEDYLNVIKSKKVELILSVQYCLVLPPAVLKAVNYNAYNLHNAKLPEYCGSFTIAHEIVNKEDLHFCTIHKMADKLDAGDIAAVRYLQINQEDTANALFWRSVYLCAVPLFYSFLAAYKSKTVFLVRMSHKGRKMYRRTDLEFLKRYVPKTKEEAYRLKRALYFPLGR